MRRFRWTLIVVVVSMISCYAYAGGMTVVNGRYFSDASGTPKFMIGYQDYSMASTLTTSYYTIDDYINAYAPYGVNYIRTLVSQCQYSATTSPPSVDDSTSRTPFLYVNGKVDLDQWDPAFWANLRADIEHAATHGIFMHLTIFDGVTLGYYGGGPWGWIGSDWNIDRQSRNFFGDLDTEDDGTPTASNEFYNTTAFNAGTGVGYYQKRLIDKTIAETGGYANVFYEVGNETGLGNGPEWSTAVRNYIITKTSKPVTLNSCPDWATCVPPANAGGWTNHGPDTPAEVKSYIAADVQGLTYPYMIDPDGSDMMDCSEADCRKAAWYSLTGGAWGWGGFSTDWFPPPKPNAPNFTKLSYYGYLLGFLDNNAVRFWEMTPHQSLISTNTTNSLLANVGAQYLAYVLSGATVNITLDTGTYSVKYFNPVTGVTTSGTNTIGPATRTFSRPTGASDWVVFVSKNTALHGGGAPAQDTVPLKRPSVPSMLTVR